MIIAVFRVMVLGMLRDRGAFAMAFLLPPLMYVVFASIFSVTTGGDLRVSVAIVDEARSNESRRLVDALSTSQDVRLAVRKPDDRQQLEAMLRKGEIDAGIVVRSDISKIDSTGEAPVQVLSDAGRAIAGPIVVGHVLRLFANELPDAAYRRTIADIERRILPLEPAQRIRVDAVIEAMKPGASGVRADERSDAGTAVVDQVTLRSSASASAAVIYYAGAVGFMFLLFSASQAATSLIDERQNSITSRMLGGTGSVAVLLGGKFLYILLQGIVQIGLIFLIAQTIYGVEVSRRFLEWSVITLAAASCAAAMSLALATVCDSRQQATTLSNFVVLIMSAVGGSMVPRFLMPDLLQQASWLFPTAWAIEAYNSLLWRDASLGEIAVPVGLLSVLSLASFLFAVLVMRRHVVR